jgi:hypothetical protein
MPDLEQPPEAVTEQPPADQAPPPDYAALYQAEKARAEAADAARAKLERDYASLKGSVRSQVTRDAEWAARLDGLQSQIATLAKGSGDDIAQEVAQTAARARQETEASRFQQEWVELNEEMKRKLLGPDSRPVLDLANAPELETVRQLYQESYSGTDLSGRALAPHERLLRMERATRLATEAAAEVKAKRAPEPPSPKPAAAAAKPPLPSMATGPSAGAASISDAEYYAEYGRNAAPFGKAPDHARIKKYLDSLK